MKILLNSLELIKELKKKHHLGFVPTMGSIHKGHEYLIKRSKKECKTTIVSIFINPAQFNSVKDFDDYPKNFSKDLKILKRLKIDFLFLPKVKDIYKLKRKKKILINKKDKILCAKYRKGHFEGVLDVMDRLTNLIKPNKIYMGEKDFQQIYLVKKFIEKKYFTKIIKCKTIRNKKNVALSSRNLLLSNKFMKIASKVVLELKKIKKIIPKQIDVDQFLKIKSLYLIKKYKIKIEYLELRKKNNLEKSKSYKDSKLFIAYYINKIRLIDNL